MTEPLTTTDVDNRAATDSKRAISAPDLEFTYHNGTTAIRNVTLDIRKGEFFGLLGPNGAGKTTLIKQLVTLLKPTVGRVTVNGFDAVEQPVAVHNTVGYTAQDTSVDLGLTARENLQYACKMYRLGGIVVVILIAELFSFVFVAFSNIVGLVTHCSDATALISNFIALPLVFLSSSFIPRSLLPAWIQTLSAFNPVTYGVTTIRTLMLDGWMWTTIGPAIVVLVVFDLVLGGLAVVLLRRATDSETTPSVRGHR